MIRTKSVSLNKHSLEMVGPMLELQFEEKEGKYYFEGIIDQRFDFIKFFADKPNPITINMHDVRRINSTGVRRWTDGIRQFPNLKIILEQCPREIIDQCNMIPEFMGDPPTQVHITSFYAYYYNEETDEEEVVLLEENKHYQLGEGLIQEPEVQEGMELDEPPNKYFNFLFYGT